MFRCHTFRREWSEKVNFGVTSFMNAPQPNVRLRLCGRFDILRSIKVGLLSKNHQSLGVTIASDFHIKRLDKKLDLLGL